MYCINLPNGMVVGATVVLTSVSKNHNKNFRFSVKNLNDFFTHKVVSLLNIEATIKL